MKKINILIRIFLFIILVTIVISCAINPVTGRKQLMLMSEEQEIAMGRSYDPQVMSTFGEYRNDQMLSFIKTKTTEMGRISHRPNLEYHIKILDSPVVNAFAVPGGYIYLTRGILAQFNNEAELMGVIGHEMGHITARHSVSQQTKQQIGQIVLIGTMALSEKLAQYAQYAMGGMQLLFLKFSRDDERVADQMGVQYSSLIGYDARKMADFFHVLEKMSMAESQGGVPTFLSTHPDPGDRYNTVNWLAKYWQDTLNYATYLVNTESYLKMIDGIVYGEDPRQGYTENNVFYQPTLKFRFSYPAAWLVENTPSQVNFAPADSKALMIFTLSSQKSLEAAADSTIAQLDLKVQERKNTSINGMPAISVISQQVTQDQSTGTQSVTQLLSYYINYNNLYYVMHGVAADTDFSTYSQAFESSMKSFSVLTDASKINVKPERIRIKEVVKTGSLSNALTYYGMKQEQMKELALLNNLELTDQVQAGRLIKIISE